MPGGGVGLFDGCKREFGGLPGAQYGGISSRSECDSFPAPLKPGCQWRFDWFKNADNPEFTFKQVQCPSELTSRTGCKRNDDSQFPAFTPPSGGGSNPSTPTTPPPSGGGSGCTAAMYAQCGGSGFSGCTNCPSGLTCKAINDYYHQCA